MKIVSFFTRNCTILSWLFFSIIGLAIQSCQTSDKIEIVNPSTNSNVNVKLIEELEKSPNSVVWISYPDLNPEEKATLWHRHLSNALSNKDYNSKQLDHIKKLDSIINADLYKKLNDPETQKFLENFHQNWFIKAVESNLFSVEQLLKISSLASIGNNSENGRVKAPMKSCDCRYGISCGGRCPDNRACTEKSFDNKFTCGIAGTSRCTGKCA